MYGEKQRLPPTLSCVVSCVDSGTFYIALNQPTATKKVNKELNHVFNLLIWLRKKSFAMDRTSDAESIFVAYERKDRNKNGRELMPRTIIINILGDDINSVFAHLLNHIDAIIRHEKQRCHSDNLCMCVSVSYHRTQCVRVYLYAGQ